MVISNQEKQQGESFSTFFTRISFRIDQTRQKTLGYKSPPAFLAIGCGSGCLTVLVGRSSLPLPPWVTRRGAVWRGKSSHRLQHDHVTPPPTYLGPGEGDGQQQQQQQYFNPRPSASPASSIPLLLPPYCTRCSVHVWRGA